MASSSSNPLRSRRSNLELAPVVIRRPSSAPHERRSANDNTDIEPRGEDMKSPLFINKFGEKHHAFPGTVPWPVSYQREVLDLDVLNHQFLKKIKGLTFADVKVPPKRILDLGTGVGSWVIDAAQQWETSTFVGVDIVPIQPDLETVALEPSLRDRIRWVNADFLQGLPFDGASFDYVRCVRIAKGVPEDKWGYLFEEISRVMAPGAFLEFIVENIVFPYVPHVAPPVATPTGITPLSPSRRGIPRHNHYFLEQIFFDVFERRFINVRPTKIVSNYLNMHFRSVTEYPIQPPTSPGGSSNSELWASMPTRRNMSSTSVSKPFEEDLSAWANETLAWQCVVGCKETMWEEVQNRNRELGVQIIDSLPWTKEEAKLTPRQRFELLFERYEQEMRDRSALPIAMRTGVGWNEPWTEPEGSLDEHGAVDSLQNLDKQQIRLSQSSTEDVEPSLLCFVGFKGSF